MSYGMDGWNHDNDLVRRKDVMDSLVKEYNRRFSLGERNGLHLAWIEKAVNEVDVAQPKPKTGKWLIRKFGDDGKCSVCGMYCGEYDLEGSDRYCRCCGAKMEGLEVSE